MVWKGATDNNPTRIAIEHEYVLCYTKDIHLTSSTWKNFNDATKDLMLEEYERIKKEIKDVSEIQRLFRKFIKDNKDSLNPLTHYDRVDEDGVYTGGRKVHNPGKEGYRYDVIHPITGKPCIQPARGYRFRESTMRELIAADKIIFGEDENQIIQIKEYLKDYSGSLKGIIELDSRVAANVLESLFGSREIFKNPKPVDLIGQLISFVTDQGSTILDFFAGSGTTAHSVLDLNREDNGRRKYLLVDSGEYFDTVLKSRIQKVIYSKDWRGGRPISREGSSHLFKYICLESYEDALNNIELKRTEEQASLLEAHDEFREDYLLQYMLDVEARGSTSLLNIEKFADPFNYQLNVATGASVGETRPVTVDLVETFNYLLGLRIKNIDTIGGFRVVEGTNPEGEKVLVIWRNTREKSNDNLDQFFQKQGYNTRDRKFDLIYTNGDNNLENLKRVDETWKVRLIEEEFQRLMFDVRDV